MDSGRPHNPRSYAPTSACVAWRTWYSALSKLSPPLREAALRSFALEEERRVSLRGWLTLERLRHELGLEDACLVAFGAERGSQICDALRMGGM